MDLQSEARYLSGFALVRETMAALRPRKRAFGDDLAMQLAAIAMTPPLREKLDKQIDRWFNGTKRDRRYKIKPIAVPEVVVGGGLHAAIYATGRHNAGFPKPLVIERGNLGGVMATSRKASFATNSRNRPGLGGLPSENRALNYLSGAPVQIADISGQEYADNADWAYAIRAMHAMHSDVMKGEVTRVEFVGTGSTPRYRVTLADGRTVTASRVVDARGFGDPRRELEGEFGSVLTFKEMLERVDKPFPLRGMRRVAIVGGGNSALCSAELLLGIAPAAGMSVATLDWVEQVDVYATNLPRVCAVWRAEIRGRYQALGSFLRPLDNGVQRLRVFQERGRVVPSGQKEVLVNGRAYDHVIDATGWKLPSGVFELEPTEAFGSTPFLALRTGETYRVGPAANLPFERYENGATARISENLVALFRLGPRTAALATTLPAVEVPELPKPAAKRAKKSATKGSGSDREPERSPAGKDRSGVQLFVGDRVQVSLGGGAEGTVLGLREGFTVVERDDGVRDVTGVGQRINPVYLERIERPQLAEDKNGRPVFAGDRILRTNAEEKDRPATVKQREGSTLVIKRDDGTSGRFVSLDASGRPQQGTIELLPFDAKFLANDKDGNPVRVGDRVKLTDGGTFTGTAIKDDLYPLAVVRDDGQTGGGKDGAWVVARSVLSYLTKLSPIATDRNGKPIYVGARVRYKSESGIFNFGGAAIRKVALNSLEFKYEFEDDERTSGASETLVRQLDQIEVVE